MRGPGGDPDTPSIVGPEIRGSDIHRVALTMPGLCCGDGAGQVNRALENMKGVCECEADFQTRSVRVAYDGARCALVDLIAAIQRVGYQVDKVHATEANGIPR